MHIRQFHLQWIEHNNNYCVRSIHCRRCHRNHLLNKIIIEEEKTKKQGKRLKKIFFYLNENAYNAL